MQSGGGFLARVEFEAKNFQENFSVYEAAEKLAWSMHGQITFGLLSRSLTFSKVLNVSEWPN